MTQCRIFFVERSTKLVDLNQYKSDKSDIMVRMMSSNVVKTIVIGKKLLILHNIIPNG